MNLTFSKVKIYYSDKPLTISIKIVYYYCIDKLYNKINNL